MNPDKQRLIQDLMNDGGEESRRTETLLAGSRVLRHRRHLRRAKWTLGVLGVAALATLCVQQWTARQPRVVAETPAPPAPGTTSHEVHRLTDDELLALFPDVPVGLATLSDGRKKLIFPRPGDEARFIRQL